ncbi:TonB-dependent hemoglobin/transferrin/lactoferrin family receptor [Pasteurella sp. PK-2025]|uniref:TonB-dependent hemoglobin/transferrin/lactoferrin family receptor n=1 Tax=Pasteurella sp. PK-2025 TaxID=3413133 RepID=UPI003C75D549
MKYHSTYQKIVRTIPFISLVALPLYAQESTELEKITVQESATAEVNKTSPNVISKGTTVIQNEMIRDTRDLVRYTTDVGISDNGRFLKGFAMRGVEDNRVGISIDGVSLPDSEENSLYARYGNFNNSRLSIDPELIQTIDIVRGADSFNAGSGTLGGSVNYKTLDPQNIVKEDKKWGALLRGSYASKNREWTRTFGVGYVGEKIDALLMYSQRTGHELKSRGSGPEYRNSSSQHPDPIAQRFHNYLAKIGYQINDNHRLGFGINGQTGSRYIDERSYTLMGSQWREADDQNERMNMNLHYIYAPSAGWLSYGKVDLDYQKTDLAAVNYKGGRNFNTDKKELNEIYDRRMKTTFTRGSLELTAQPIHFYGEHTLTLKAYMSQRDFKNVNNDRIGIGENYESVYHYTIQYPIRTTQYGVSLKDHARWNETFSSHLGWRYDYTKLKPRALNAPCSEACLGEGKPNPAHFSTVSTFASIEAQLNPDWRLGYNISTGYRVPTASEMFFSFTNAYGTWKSNPSLKPEKSLNQTLSLKGNGEKGLLDLSLYQTNYRHFLFEQESIIPRTEMRFGQPYHYQAQEQQMVNIDKAKIYGLELKTHANLDQFISAIPQGFKFYGALGYSKGKLSNQASLLSIQPVKIIVGLDYEAPSGKWAIFNRLTYLGEKKAGDAKAYEIKSRCIELITELDPWSGEQIQRCKKRELYPHLSTYKHLNKSAFVFDTFGYYHITHDITLRAGIYNLFNKKYHTWDALRGINANSTLNSVDREGKGLERFYAPGRNYAASLEVRF